jgi:predicted transposase/invertase (TIGR01784 family)
VHCSDERAREQAVYEERYKFRHDMAARLANAREEGYQEGLRLAREELNREWVRQIAAKLKSSGMDVTQIAEITELTVDEVEKL